MSTPSLTQISERILALQLPELGKIKIGGRGAKRMSQKGSEYYQPVKYDHFVVTTRVRDESGNFVKDRAIHAKIGEKPQQIDVRLLWDEPERNFRASLEAYDGRRCVCRGNGERAIDAVHGEIPCPCPWLKQFTGAYEGPKREVGKVSCKPHGRLYVVLDAGEVFGGYWVLRTTSWETIRNLAAQLRMFKAQFGYLAWLPLTLRLYPAEDTYQDGDQTKTSTSYKVAFVVRATTEQAFRLAKAEYEKRLQLALPASAAAAAAVGVDEAREEEEQGEAIAAEFHPETQDAEIIPEEEQKQSEAEVHCRLTLEYSDWEPLRVNQQIAKYDGRLDELAAILQEKLPQAYHKAREELERRNAVAADVEIISEDGGTPAPATATVQAELF